MTDPANPSCDPGERATSDMEEEPTSDMDTSEEEDEKDAQDHLTPAALVHAASGIPLHRLRNAIDVKDSTPRNVCDLKDDNSPDEHDDDFDKVLSAAPPTLARQSAVPSQPGAFHAGGDARRRRTEDVSVGVVTIPAPVDLIEATLVEEEEEPPVQAPVYKGQIVLEEDALENEKSVILSKKYVRYFAMAFTVVSFVAIVLAVALVVVGDDEDPTASRASGRNQGGPTLDNDDESMENSYWYLGQSPQRIWETLAAYTYVTHHMAIVSIVNPQIASEEASCTPLRYDFANTSEPFHPYNVSLRGTQRKLRPLVRRDLLAYASSDNVVVVSFTCGSTATENVSPNTSTILVHNVEGESIAALTGNTTADDIHCQDATFPNGTAKHNEVLCFIPNSGADGHYPFLFSCFSHMKESTVAEVRTWEASAACTIANTTTNSTTVISSPAVVVLSTQRLCRLSDGSVLLEGSLLGEWNESSVACPDHELESHSLSGVPVCLSSSGTMPNRSDTVEGSSSVVQLGLPNVTILDRLSDDEAECSYISVPASLIATNVTDFPRLQALNETTVEQLEEYLTNQELLVQQWLLRPSS
jgi:hypothetical protein